MWLTFRLKNSSLLDLTLLTPTLYFSINPWCHLHDFSVQTKYFKVIHGNSETFQVAPPMVGWDLEKLIPLDSLNYISGGFLHKKNEVDGVDTNSVT